MAFREAALQTHEIGVYSPEKLAMLYRVFDESFRIAAGDGFVRSELRDHVRFRLAQVIMCGAARGVKNPLALRRMALTAVAMGYLGNSAVH